MSDLPSSPIFDDNECPMLRSPVLAIDSNQFGRGDYYMPKSPTISSEGKFGNCTNDKVLTSSPNVFNESDAITQRLNDSDRVDINGEFMAEGPMSPVLLMSYSGPSVNTEEMISKIDTETPINSEQNEIFPSQEIDTSAAHDYEVQFQSAGGRLVQPSANSLNKVKAIWNEIMDNSEQFLSKKLKPNQPISLDEVKKRKERVSQEGIVSSLKEFAFSSSSVKAVKSDVKTSTCDGSLSKPGIELLFKSAAGHPVRPSDVSLTKVKAMWNDVNESNSTPHSVSSHAQKHASFQPALDKTSDSNAELLFKSGTGRSVKPSTASLIKVNAMWNDTVASNGTVKSSSNPNDGDLSISPNRGCISIPNTEVLFKSAAGRSVKPSVASLNKVKTMWNDINDSEIIVGSSEITNLQTAHKISPSCDGKLDNEMHLQSAVNRKTKASASLKVKATRNVINENDDIVVTSNVSSSKPGDEPVHHAFNKTCEDVTKCLKPSNEILFKSAAGINVKPSAASLMKMKAMWNEINDTDIVVSTNTNKSTFKPDGAVRQPAPVNSGKCSKSDNEIIFKSAAGNSVTPSAASLTKVKAMWNDVICEVNTTNADNQLHPSTSKVEQSPIFPTSTSSNVDPTASNMYESVDTTKKKRCSRQLSLYEPTKKTSLCQESGDCDENKVTGDSREPSPVLDCSFVAENDPSTVSNDVWNDSFTKPFLTPDKATSSQHNLNKMGDKYDVFDEEMENLGIPGDQCKSSQNVQNSLNASADWEEFPDIRSSQAVLLEKVVNVPNLSDKENVSLNLNKMTQSIPGNKARSTLPFKTHMASRPVSNQQIERSHSQESINRTVTAGCTAPQKRKSDPLESASKKLKTSQSCKILWQKLRKRQEDLIAAQRTSKLSFGLLTEFKDKSIGRYRLQTLEYHMKFADGSKDHKLEVKQSVIGITSENAIHHRFDSSSIYCDCTKIYNEGALVADACLTVLAHNNSAGLDEAAKAFLTSPHVNPKHISHRWIRNHYRWIVWKLASYERNFPRLFNKRCLCLENVLLQLKYRFDREIGLAHRSCFKKILEADAAPDKFICCVASIIRNKLDEGDSTYELELTDGWYSVRTTIDKEMAFLCEKGVVSVGTKLMVYGAEIINGGQGCDPLEVSPDLRMKISTNSVRRVKWFAKMGFVSNNEPIPTLLCSVLPNGGLIGQMTAVLVRKYPLIYMGKDAEGKTVFRSERSEAVYREQRNKIRAETMEQTYEVILKEVESKYRNVNVDRAKKSLTEGISHISDPEVLYEIISTGDGEYLQSQLTKEQLAAVSNYKEALSSRIKGEVERRIRSKIEGMESETKVTKILKARLMDLFTEKEALLTIWRPSDDELNLIRENRAFEFFNLIASGTRENVLQLSSHKLSKYVINSQITVDANCHRVLTSIKEIESSNFTPAFGEIDVVGVVVLVKLSERSKGVTSVILSDLEGRHLSITFWTSLSVFGCEDMMKEGSVISCSNLQWRSVSNQRSMPQVFVSERTSFSLKPKSSHLQNAVAGFKKKFGTNFVESLSTAKAQALHALKIKDSRESPLAAGKSFNSPDSRRLSTTPVQDKLKFLNRYCSENIPPLSPTPLVVTTRHVFSDFKSPCTPKNGKIRPNAKN